jgi:diguanylate cyclase (GGDEF)-like protein/PAS domain S-box-containing protein
MQNALLDILILGLLVLLFASIYRKRASRRLRFWGVGWLFILLHFAVLLLNPVSDLAQNLAAFVILGSLLLSGVAFILAAISPQVRSKYSALIGAVLSVPSLVFIAAALVVPSDRSLLYVIIVIVETCVLLAGTPLRARGRQTFQALAGSAMICSAWAAATVARGDAVDAVYAFLTQIFFMTAFLYWKEFRRFSAGVLTASLGLVAWSAVFPVALALHAFLPKVAVPGELWNIPKYFVAFGMILTLLEEEIATTSKASENYRLLFAANPHPMWIYATSTLTFLQVNDAAIAHYGFTREEFSTMMMTDIWAVEDIPALRRAIANATATKLSGPWKNRKKDGTWIQVDLASQAIEFEGQSARFVMVQDVTDREYLHQQLVHQAHHDSLTGLPNRLLLKDRMEQALISAGRHEHKAALLCMDLDRFKQINDTYGHAVGDMCLKHVADILRLRLRGVDTVARTGGEEFTVVLSQLTHVSDAEVVTKDLLHALRRPVEMDGFRIDLSASIGVAIYPDDGVDSLSLWRSADAAMYRAKRSGGNQYLFVSHEISTSASEANEIELYMKRMIHEGGFELHYQPQYTLGGKLRGLEALLRLSHPRFGDIPPDRFIPIAEESGLIVRIGNWVLEEVCRQVGAWRDEGVPPIKVALNVSPLQFMQLDFSSYVENTIAKHQLDPQVLELELTETTVMRNLQDVAVQMNTLASLGIHFAVDDFGTGYSSLGHLHQLPITTLKIDRSFVEQIAEENGTFNIVQAIISMAHSLGMEVIAEGVETRSQALVLRNLHCDLLQGYLFSRPLRAEAVPALVREDATVNTRRIV